MIFWNVSHKFKVNLEIYKKIDGFRDKFTN